MSRTYIKFREVQNDLTANDVDQLVALLGYRCRVETCKRIRSILTYGASTIPDFGIMRRLVRDDKGRWEYIAGQSYPDEMRIVRNIVMKGRP